MFESYEACCANITATSNPFTSLGFHIIVLTSDRPAPSVTGSINFQLLTGIYRASSDIRHIIMYSIIMYSKWPLRSGGAAPMRWNHRKFQIIILGLRLKTSLFQ